MDDEARSLLAVAVGNTRTRFGLFRTGELIDPTAVMNSDMDAIVAGALRALEGVHGVDVVIASVNNPVADKIERALEDAISDEVYRVGRDLSVPMAHSLEDASTLGHDRVLSALGAFARSQQACVVVDAGTAITVDFVDGEGTFHGGVIAPGVRMMLKSLHEQTAALPEIEFSVPREEEFPFGKDTRRAMLLGVIGAARGLVHHQIHQYAEAFGAYPQIVATGGDAAALFEGDDLVEHIVPDLQLMGIYEAAKRALAEDEEDDAGGDE